MEMIQTNNETFLLYLNTDVLTAELEQSITAQYKEFSLNFERDNEGNWFVNGDKK
jgi:hypothetical protein